VRKKYAVILTTCQHLKKKNFFFSGEHRRYIQKVHKEWEFMYDGNRGMPDKYYDVLLPTGGIPERRRRRRKSFLLKPNGLE